MNAASVLYKYQSMNKIGKYICIGNININGKSMLLMECQTCNHGSKCVVVVEANDKGNYSFVSMYPAKEIDHECWHTTYTEQEEYYVSLKKLKTVLYESRIDDRMQQISKHVLAIKQLEQEMKELSESISNLTEE